MIPLRAAKTVRYPPRVSRSGIRLRQLRQLRRARSNRSARGSCGQPVDFFYRYRKRPPRSIIRAPPASCTTRRFRSPPCRQTCLKSSGMPVSAKTAGFSSSLHGIEARFGQQEMQQTAHPGHGIVDHDRYAGAERVNGGSPAGIRAKSGNPLLRRQSWSFSSFHCRYRLRAGHGFDTLIGECGEI